MGFFVGSAGHWRQWRMSPDVTHAGARELRSKMSKLCLVFPIIYLRKLGAD